METLQEIKAEIAEKKGYRDWASLTNDLRYFNSPTYPDLLDEIAKKGIHLALHEVVISYNEKINELRELKLECKKGKHQAAWNILDNEQKIWEEAKKIAMSLQRKNFNQ